MIRINTNQLDEYDKWVLGLDPSENTPENNLENDTDIDYDGDDYDANFEEDN